MDIFIVWMFFFSPLLVMDLYNWLYIFDHRHLFLSFITYVLTFTSGPLWVMLGYKWTGNPVYKVVIEGQKFLNIEAGTEVLRKWRYVLYTDVEASYHGKKKCILIRRKRREVLWSSRNCSKDVRPLGSIQRKA